MNKEKNVIEKAWKTQSGLAAIVIMTSMGHRCGYVAVLPGHSLHGVGYSDETFALLPPKPDTPIGKRGVFTLLGAALSGTIARSPEMVFDVHGGITFSGELKHELLQEKLGKFDPWWFGYDCAHAGDAASPEYYERMRQEHPTRPFMWEPVVGGVHRDLDYCINECESLASQIRTLTAPRWRAWLRRVWAAVRRT